MLRQNAYNRWCCRAAMAGTVLSMATVAAITLGITKARTPPATQQSAFVTAPDIGSRR